MKNLLLVGLLFIFDCANAQTFPEFYFYDSNGNSFSSGSAAVGFEEHYSISYAPTLLVVAGNDDFISAQVSQFYQIENADGLSTVLITANVSRSDSSGYYVPPETSQLLLKSADISQGVMIFSSNQSKRYYSSKLLTKQELELLLKHFKM